MSRPDNIQAPSLPVLLCGDDYEGERREIWFPSMEAARAAAVADSDQSDGFGWRAWEIWANTGVNGKWCCAASWALR